MKKHIYTKPIIQFNIIVMEESIATGSIRIHPEDINAIEIEDYEEQTLDRELIGL